MPRTTIRLSVGVALSGAVLLSGCATTPTTVAPTTSSPTPTTTSAVAAPPPPAVAAPRTRDWFDLQVGDCLSELPQIDLGVVSVGLVDCAAGHVAEVFLRAPLEVNTAVADVANRQCTAGFAKYTGRSVGGLYGVTYLIDSNQDRTSNNPYPSTVICLLQSASGAPLTGSPRA